MDFYLILFLTEVLIFIIIKTIMIYTPAEIKATINYIYNFFTDILDTLLEIFSAVSGDEIPEVELEAGSLEPTSDNSSSINDNNDDSNENNDDNNDHNDNDNDDNENDNDDNDDDNNNDDNDNDDNEDNDDNDNDHRQDQNEYKRKRDSESSDEENRNDNKKYRVGAADTESDSSDSDDGSKSDDSDGAYIAESQARIEELRRDLIEASPSQKAKILAELNATLNLIEEINNLNL